VLTRARTWSAAIWHPELRLDKALLSVANNLDAAKSDAARQRVIAGPLHQAFEHHLRALAAGACAQQYEIWLEASADGSVASRLIYRSELQPL
jgi:hypothetical protein